MEPKIETYPNTSFKMWLINGLIKQQMDSESQYNMFACDGLS